MARIGDRDIKSSSQSGTAIDMETNTYNNSDNNNNIN